MPSICGVGVLKIETFERLTATRAGGSENLVNHISKGYKGVFRA